MDNFCRACGKSIEFGGKLCSTCQVDLDNEWKRLNAFSQDEVYFEVFCLTKRNEQMSTTLQKVLDEKANLFMENLHLKEEIRQLLAGKGNEVLEGIKEKLEGLTKGYQELQERTMGLASYGGPKSS